MAKYLSVVEVAYRATVEEQDDTALWFTHAMKNGGADVGVLLRGNAVNYAVKAQNGAGLAVGARSIKGADIAHDVRALVQKQVSVMVVGDDAQERGISPKDFVEGVETISRSAIAGIFDKYDRIIHW